MERRSIEARTTTFGRRMVLFVGGVLSLTASVLFACVVSEFIARGFLQEVDYLAPVLIDDPDLGQAIAPGSAGHDSWGFRNEIVPDSVDIVAIGDSQTYGVSATARDSWPSALSRLSGKSIYNMGLGGFGPAEYRHLLVARAPQLRPELVLIGFYLGNDLYDAYESTIGKRPRVATDASPARAFPGIRGWLSRTSVLYQMAKLNGGSLIEWLRYREARGKTGMYPVQTDAWRTVLTPEPRLAALDQGIMENRVGLEVTQKIFGEIPVLCEELGTKCIVVLIPTKETVFWPVAKSVLSEQGREAVRRVVEQEAIVKKNLISFFAQARISYLDATPAMQSAAKARGLYPGNHDGHPNRYGYSVIAELLASSMTLWTSI